MASVVKAPVPMAWMMPGLRPSRTKEWCRCHQMSTDRRSELAGDVLRVFGKIISLA
jgi:hypothetical protein